MTRWPWGSGRRLSCDRWSCRNCGCARWWSGAIASSRARLFGRRSLFRLLRGCRSGRSGLRLRRRHQRLVDPDCVRRAHSHTRHAENTVRFSYRIRFIRVACSVIFTCPPLVLKPLEYGNRANRQAASVSYAIIPIDRHSGPVDSKRLDTLSLLRVTMG